MAYFEGLDMWNVMHAILDATNELKRYYNRHYGGSGDVNTKSAYGYMQKFLSKVTVSTMRGVDKPLEIWYTGSGQGPHVDEFREILSGPVQYACNEWMKAVNVAMKDPPASERLKEMLAGECGRLGMTREDYLKRIDNDLVILAAREVENAMN